MKTLKSLLIVSCFVVFALGLAGCSSLGGSETECYKYQVNSGEYTFIIRNVKFKGSESQFKMDGPTFFVQLEGLEFSPEVYKCSEYNPDVKELYDTSVGDLVTVQMSFFPRTGKWLLLRFNNLGIDEYTNLEGGDAEVEGFEKIEYLNLNNLQ